MKEKFCYVAPKDCAELLTLKQEDYDRGKLILLPDGKIVEPPETVKIEAAELLF